MHRSITFAAVLVGGVCASGLASAQEYTGFPFGTHLNPGVPGRGVCTILDSPSPSVPGSPWFCNYRSGNPLYNEINRLLEQTAVNGLDCKIGSSALGPDGHHRIQWISCPSF